MEKKKKVQICSLLLMKSWRAVILPGPSGTVDLYLLDLVIVVSVGFSQETHPHSLNPNNPAMITTIGFNPFCFFSERRCPEA